MNLSWTATLAGLAAGAAALHSTQADVVHLGPVKDNTLYFSTTGSLSSGAAEHFFAGSTFRTEPRRGLVQFDVSILPPGSTITSATLTLTLTRTSTGAQPVSLHRALADWGEAQSLGGPNAGGGGQAQPGDATWLHRFYPGEFWTTEGGDFQAAASATTTVEEPLTAYSWSSPGLAGDVQFWLDQGSNFGWLVKGEESQNQTSKRFASREHADPALRPVLSIAYTPPPGIGGCCLADGSCQFASAAQCSSLSGIYQGDGILCSPTPCPNAVGACCLSETNCITTTQSSCLSQSGVFRGHNTTCAGNPCAPPTGACCFHGGACSVLSATACAAGSGAYRGNGTNCATISCPFTLEPYVDMLPIPPVAVPYAGQIAGTASYQIVISEFDHSWHRDLQPTRMWGYDGRTPGPTIIASVNNPVTVDWFNDIRDPSGAHRQQHFLPVDPCMMGIGTAGNQPRTVVHLHGGKVPPEHDGKMEFELLPGQSRTDIYPNIQVPGTLLYHDHAMGITRLNIQMGLVAAYVLVDAFELGLPLPGGAYQVPLVIQDRSFNPDGSLRYPAVWQDDFFGDFMTVNGRVQPFLYVSRGKYRFRAGNGCNARTLTLSLSDGATFHQIGTDGGLLPAPVPLTELTLTPGERADLIVDFGGYAPNTEIILRNSAPAPYPGPPGVGVLPEVMKFIVTATSGFTDPIPQTLRPVERLDESLAAISRDFLLRKIPEPCRGEMWAINDLTYEDITERPRLGTYEIWRFINTSMMTHPMHPHLVQFQVLDRQPFQIVGGQIVPSGPAVPVPAHEAGWKDTVRCDPMEITRIIIPFDTYLGKYSYHCHSLEHEEHAMHRQFETTCYANCDASTVAPIINVADFSCFLQHFAAANPYANCDGSTTPPVLNVADFGCFLQKFAAGCP